MKELFYLYSVGSSNTKISAYIGAKLIQCNNLKYDICKYSSDFFIELSNAKSLKKMYILFNHSHVLLQMDQPTPTWHSQNKSRELIIPMNQ